MTPLETARTRFAGKNVLIFGLGLLGGAAGDARFFCELGANVRVTDQKDAAVLEPTITALSDLSIEYTLGRHDQKDVDWADCIVKNPAIPNNHPLLAAARQAGKPVLMRSSLFFELANIFTIGITGTRGKTTTTAMIYDLVSRLSGKQVILGGNVNGISDLQLLSQITDPDNTIAVMELSSWQLQGFAEIKRSPQLAVITNLYPDHLNKYPDLETYYADKRTILAYQQPDDTVVLNKTVSECVSWAQTAPSQVVWFNPDELPDSLTLKVPGKHNRANAAAALKVAEVFGYPRDQVEAILAAFSGVPFRLEKVAVKEDVTYINDTTATTPQATLAALESIPDPIIICGGFDKHLPVADLAEALNAKAKAIILLPGTGTDIIKPLLTASKIRSVADTMASAVDTAKNLAVPGDTVLLSPGFASFGLFQNEFDRGFQFNQAVELLP